MFCVLFYKRTPHEHKLTSKPFQNLSKAKSGKEGAFVKHSNNSTQRRDATYAAKNFLLTFKEPTTGRIVVTFLKSRAENCRRGTGASWRLLLTQFFSAGDRASPYEDIAKLM